MASPVGAAVPPDAARLPAVAVAGQFLQVYVESAAFLAALLGDIQAARRRVWIETYIFTDDAAGQAVAAALAERAQHGVDVRVHYDAFGSSATAESLFAELQLAGVRVHAFHTLGHALGNWSFWRVFNSRNHRKLVCIDDEVAYFGGMNIVAQGEWETPPDPRRQHWPVGAPWRDLHVRLQGPAQAELRALWQESWLQAHGVSVRRKRRWPDLEAVVRSPDDGVYFFACRPGFRRRRAERIFGRLIRAARRSVTFAMAYFIPLGGVLRALRRAHRRGVRLRAIVPARSDVPLVAWATRHFYESLLRSGFRIYERQHQMLHAKAMVIDDRFTLVGSCNLDPRSLRTNLELAAVVRSQEFARLVQRVCAYEVRRSLRIRPANLARRGWAQRLLGSVAWFFRWWL